MILRQCGDRHKFAISLIICSFLIVPNAESKSVATTISSVTERENVTISGSLNADSEIFRNGTSEPISKTDPKAVVNESAKKANFTNSNFLIEYKPVVFDSPEDIKTQQEWGGNCTLAHWDQCKVLAKYFGKYEDPKDGEIKEYVIDCREEPVVCLTNR